LTHPGCRKAGWARHEEEKTVAVSLPPPPPAGFAPYEYGQGAKRSDKPDLNKANETVLGSKADASQGASSDILVDRRPRRPPNPKTASTEAGDGWRRECLRFRG
jgi:hypothetical protein